MGYSETQKRYKPLDISSNQFCVYRDVVFKEHIFPFIVDSTTVKVSHRAHDRGIDMSSHNLEPLHLSFPSHVIATENEEFDIAATEGHEAGYEGFDNNNGGTEYHG